MFKVNSKKAVRRIANKSFMANRTRNVIAVAAIALTAVLFTALFTVSSGMIEYMQKHSEYYKTEQIKRIQNIESELHDI